MRFCGRVAELDELIARWKLASDIAAPAPQLAILKAERGVGKTRLAIEFYRWLSENIDAKGPDGYWPDSVSILDRSIDVNPDPYACRYDQSMPFLWWGLRATDPGTENRISGEAVASYDKFLAPHLVALTMKARSIKSGKALLGVWRDVAKGEAASWSGYDTVMSVGEGLFKTVQILRGTMEQSRSSALGEITKKSINRVDAVLEDLEIVLNTRSPGFAKTPAVILIDDAQFSTEDPGLADFCEKLLHMAMTQKWPLMILVTHWKRDLSPEFMTTEQSFAGVVHHARTRAPQENGPVAGLPGGYLTAQNTVEIDLAPVPDLTEALHHALPGLLPDQAKALLDHAGGNPRHLEQIIAFLRENEHVFEHFDRNKALTQEGMQEALKKTHRIFEVVMHRLQAAPAEVQEAICLASLQGMRFVSDIVNDLAKVCLAGDRAEALKKAGDPFSMVSARYKASIAEFSERLFYLVAQERRRSLKGLHDTAALTTALQDVLRERIAQIDIDQVEDVDGAVMTFGLAAQAFAATEPKVALKALSSVTKLEQVRYAHASAVAAAIRFKALFSPEVLKEASLDIWSIFAVTDALSSDGRNADALAILTPLIEQIRTNAARLQTLESQRDLAALLSRVGNAAMDAGDLAMAAQLWQEGLDITRDLATRLQTPESQRDLRVLLFKVGDAAKAAGDLATAAQLWQEGLNIARDLATRLQSSESQCDLFFSLIKVGDAATDLADLATAAQVWQESLGIARDLATRLQTPESQRDLFVSLDRAGDAAMDAGDLVTATQLWKEGLDITRDLAAQLQTPESQRDLKRSLESAGDAAKAAGDLATAAQLWQESLGMARNLAARMQTPESQRDLFVSLDRVGDAAMDAGDLVTATQLWQEGLDITRDLAERLQTPESQRDLSISLDRVGDAALYVGDLATAAQLLQEGLGITRGLATRLQTPRSQRALLVSLNKVGDAAKVAGDLATAAQLWQEGLGIARDLVTRLQAPQSQRDLFASLDRVGNAAMDAGDLAAAAQVWQEGLDITRDLATQLQTPESQRDLFVSLNKVGDSAKAADDLVTAAQLFQKSLGIAHDLAERLQTPESQRDLFVSLNKVGDAAKAVGDLAMAAQLWQKGLGIARDLVTRLQTPESQRDVCVSLYKLCRLYIENDDLVLAASVLTEGQSLATELPLHMRDEAVAAFAGLREAIS